IGFRIKIDAQIITGEVQEKEEAFETYDDAMSEGHGAFLLDQERPNIFTASVGNLNPKQIVEIEITYVSQLKNEGKAIRFFIPTTVSPRYTPTKSPPQLGESDAEKFNSPRWLTVPYGLSLKVDIQNMHRIIALESPSHTIRTRYGDGGAQIELSQSDAALNKDFVLLIESEQSDKPTAIVSHDGDENLTALVTFCPKSTDLPEVRSEVIFLLDCSGSMGGNSIREAKRALQLCIRGLCEGDTFNLICFGSNFKAMWSSSKAYDQKSLEEAQRYIEGIDANLGGTEILSPLEHITNQRPDPERPRQVILLTDGQVSNEDAVIHHCKKNASNTRIFSFGIGSGVSEHLVRGIARASRGATEFIHPKERIEPKVLRMFGRLSTPALTNIQVDWGELTVEQSPKVIPAIFGGDPLTVFARFPKSGAGGIHTLTLRAGTSEWPLALDLRSPQENPSIPALWARERIREIEEIEHSGSGSQQRRQRKARPKKEQEIIDLGCRYGLITRLTSYVAVETRSDENRTSERSHLRKIPIALTEDWGQSSTPMHSGTGFFSLPPPMPMAAQAAAPPPMQMRRPKARASRSRPLFNRIPSPVQAIRNMFSPPTKGYTKPESIPDRPSPNTNPSNDLDELFKLLMTQNADGSFPLSEVLMHWLQDRFETVNTAMHINPDIITSVVVALLEKEAPHNRAEWKRAADKARSYLQQNGNPSADHLI
ncbi:MAG: VIT and VWA domain-containing protein, partial [Myxococcota bacterium]|nr:VIT and VWA domain-containing protein [Myxococcota bacterium]